MGKEYWRWCSSADPSTAKSSSSSSSSSSAQSKSNKDSASAGCISALFHYFDFHLPHLHSHHHLIPANIDQPITLQKGLDAPRNSLESVDETSTSPASTSKQDENLNLPVINRIKTSCPDTRPTSASTTNDCFSDISSSSPAIGGSNTPGLVARLMGLDPLPHCDSPSFSSPASSSLLKLKPSHGRTTAHRNSFEGTRSLPETPRISLARRSVDADCCHHRLSLQINKENMTVNGVENRSPSYHARQIVTQVKDRIARKSVAPLTDVTNTTTPSRDQQQQRHGHASISDASSSCSPRLRTSDHKTRNKVINKNTRSVSASKANSPQHVIKEDSDQPPPRQTKKCKNASTSTCSDPKFKMPQRSTSDIIRNKQEEPFVRPAAANRTNLQDKNCKKTPLSSQLVTASGVPSTLLPVKRDPSPPDIKIPQKQVLSDAQKSKRRSFSQLPNASSQRYKQEATYEHAPRNSDNRYDLTNGGGTTTAISAGEAAENEYVTSILRRLGIAQDKPVSSTIWFSPAHPLDPSIFFYLEHFSTASSVVRTAVGGCLGHHWNRKLLFQLVDEILVDILKPYLKIKPWFSSIKRDLTQMKGAQLIETITSKIRSFPGADCRVLEDIDALVDMDLPLRKLQITTSYEEEGEGIVTEIEKDVVDTLILETTAYFLFESSLTRGTTS